MFERVQTEKPFKALVFHTKFPELNTRIEYSNSLKETLIRAKEWIRSYRADRDWENVDSVTVCFNSEFLHDVMGDEKDFWFEFNDGVLYVTLDEAQSLEFGAHDTNRKGQDYRM